MALIVLILFTTVGGSYYACLGALVAKLYSNVALAVLNSRIRIVGGRDESHQLATSDVYVGGAQGLSSRPDPMPTTSVFAVNVTRTRDVRGDDSSSGANMNKNDAAGDWEENTIPMHAIPPASNVSLAISLGSPFPLICGL